MSDFDRFDGKLGVAGMDMETPATGKSAMLNMDCKKALRFILSPTFCMKRGD